VPGTDASTKPRGPSAGMSANSAGRSGVAQVHGPESPGAENQRPETRNQKVFLEARKSAASVFATYSSDVPGIAT
jgi:hypothetical protein